jgi:Na+/melibiose symporter-like transporter
MDQKMAFLTEEEKAKLKIELSSNYITAISLFSFGIMLIMFIYILGDEESTDLWKYIIAIFLLTIITFILTRKFTKSIREEILSDTKIVEEFSIDQRYSFVDREDRFSQGKMKFIIVANGIKYNVTEEQFIQSEKSNILAIHKTSKREALLKVEIINRP